MDFKSAKQLLELCQEEGKSISEIMKIREMKYTEKSEDEINQKMKTAFEIMKKACHSPIVEPHISMGGLIGGESKKLEAHFSKGENICGNVVGKAIQYAMGVLEVNASMGQIVAAPTAGASGVVPGVLVSLYENYDLDYEEVIDSLFTASAIGYLAMRNATVSGAVGGCQAEVGVASAMAAAMATDLFGGTPKQCLDAASMALMNLLGMVCDPIAGLVECPCQSRNAMGASNSLTCAQIILSGVRQRIPFDEILLAMLQVGKRLPSELRETALGGTAMTETAKNFVSNDCNASNDCIACNGCGLS